MVAPPSRWQVVGGGGTSGDLGEVGHGLHRALECVSRDAGQVVATIAHRCQPSRLDVDPLKRTRAGDHRRLHEPAVQQRRPRPERRGEQRRRLLRQLVEHPAQPTRSSQLVGAPPPVHRHEVRAVGHLEADAADDGQPPGVPEAGETGEAGMQPGIVDTGERHDVGIGNRQRRPQVVVEPIGRGQRVEQVVTAVELHDHEATTPERRADWQWRRRRGRWRGGCVERGRGGRGADNVRRRGDGLADGATGRAAIAATEADHHHGPCTQLDELAAIECIRHRRLLMRS